jgi:UDP-N-acetylglucosamine--N-acetylmuramyl-(pentapeptide) pyrophosphoryl-undecaprenol N-acetylglucosamine transferase
LRIPVVVHEQTIIPGLANRIVGRIATRILLSFKETSSFFDSAKTTFVGNPLRAELKKGLPDRDEALSRLGLNPKLPVLYVTGGAQGANAINKVVADALPDLLKDWQIIHQCGVNSMEYDATYLAEVAKNLDGNLARHYLVKPYVGREIVDVFAVADVLLSRSGAATINEILQLGLTAILIPYPASASQEQQRLAQMLEKAGAAMVIDQSILTREKLVEALRELSPDKRASMKEMAKALAPERIDHTLSDVILQAAQPK